MLLSTSDGLINLTLRIPPRKGEMRECKIVLKDYNAKEAYSLPFMKLVFDTPDRITLNRTIGKSTDVGIAHIELSVPYITCISVGGGGGPITIQGAPVECPCGKSIAAGISRESCTVVVGGMWHIPSV